MTKEKAQKLAILQQCFREELKSIGVAFEVEGDCRTGEHVRFYSRGRLISPPLAPNEACWFAAGMLWSAKYAITA